jgi:chromosome segregation ATPase
MADQFVFDIFGVGFNEYHLGVAGVFALVALIAVLKATVWKKELAKLRALFNEMDEEKTKYYDRCKDLEAENKNLQEKLLQKDQKLEEEREKLKEKEGRMKEGSRNLEEGLLKIEAMKESLDHHRIRIGSLEKEKEGLNQQIRDLKKQLTQISSIHKQELESQRDSYELKINELKGKTKDLMTQFADEKEQKLKDLQEEVEKLRETNQKLKERLGLWESVGDL